MQKGKKESDAEEEEEEKRVGNEAAEGEEASFDNETDRIKVNLTNSSRYYYALTHSVKEEIPE